MRFGILIKWRCFFVKADMIRMAPEVTAAVVRVAVAEPAVLEPIVINSNTECVDDDGDYDDAFINICPLIVLISCLYSLM